MPVILHQTNWPVHQFFPKRSGWEDEDASESSCGMDDCYFANRAISRVHTTGDDLRTMGLNPQGNQVERTS